MALNYGSDETTNRWDLDDFFKRFDEDVLPHYDISSFYPYILEKAWHAYINNEWSEFVERVKEETK